MSSPQHFWSAVNRRLHQTNPPIIGGRLTRPAWLCSQTNQIVVLVEDKSSSMAGAKAVDASAACSDLVDELAQPVNKDGFIVGIVHFDSSANVVHDLTKATQLSGNMKPISPCGSTSITAGLEQALALIHKSESQTTAGQKLLRPVVIAFSDGCHNTGPAPHGVARQISMARARWCGPARSDHHPASG